MQDGFHPVRLLADLGYQQAQEGLEMSLLVLASAICQRREPSLRLVGKHDSVLQVIHCQGYHCEPLLDGFEGLQAEVTETEDFLEIQVIDFHGPTLLIEAQGLLGRQGDVGAQEVPGVWIASAFFRNDDVDLLLDLLEMPMDGADEVGASRTRVYSLQRDLLVGLVLERLVVAVDALFLDLAIGLEGTHYLPFLAQAEIDQFRGGIPGVEEHIDLAVCWQERFQFQQHLPSQVVLAAIGQTIFLRSGAVEMTYFLLPQKQPGVEQKAKGTDLQMQLHVYIPVAPCLAFLRALAVIVVIIHRLQVFGGFAFLTQTVIQTGQDLRLQPRFGSQFQQCAHHELLARLADQLHRPGAFSKEVGQCLRIRCPLQKTG